MSRSCLVLVACLLFLALQQDVWFWEDDATWFFGFLPVGIAFHAVYTLGLALFWYGVVTVAWPSGLDDEETDQG